MTNKTNTSERIQTTEQKNIILTNTLNSNRKKTVYKVNTNNNTRTDRQKMSNIKLLANESKNRFIQNGTLNKQGNLNKNADGIIISDIKEDRTTITEVKKIGVRNNSVRTNKSVADRKILDDFDYYMDDYEPEYTHTLRKKNGTDHLKVIFLGGVGEIGKNMTAFEFGDEIIVVDCGSSFPDYNMHGIDLIIPDTTYLTENISKVKGILLTHGHEDHIGGLPYILDKIDVPVYGSKLTLALLESKLSEKSIKATTICIDEQTETKGKKSRKKSYRIGNNFEVEFIPVCHSIAGSNAIYIKTPKESVVHSGDFKIDFTPAGNHHTDLTRFAEIGKEGVDLLLCESTNVDRKGFSMSESMVGKTFEDIFEKNKEKRLVVATFASNISRLQQVLTLCEKFNRKVAFAGRSMVTVTDIASNPEIDELHFNKKIIVDIDNIGDYKDSELLILCTGSQGEDRSALVRMANDEFNKVQLGENDLVIFSASQIPGNEKSIYNTINNLYRMGCDVIYNELADVHVSGHACQEEIKTIHSLIKPKYFIPVHGEYRHLRFHKELAKSMGMEENNIMICEIGNCVKVTKSGLKKLDPVPSGMVFVDGLGLGDTDSAVLKERYVLANEGVCVVMVSISKITCNMTSDPEIVTRGLVYRDETGTIIQGAKQVLKEKINSSNYDRYDQLKIRNDIKKELQKYFVKAIYRKPMILTILLENSMRI